MEIFSKLYVFASHRAHCCFWVGWGVSAESQLDNSPSGVERAQWPSLSEHFLHVPKASVNTVWSPKWRGGFWLLWLISHFLTVWPKVPKHRNVSSKGYLSGTSLLVQYLRTHLPRQGTWVRSLVWEDPICQGATEPASHSYCRLPSRSHDYESPHTSKNLRSATGKVTARSLRTTLERSPSSRRSEGPCSTEHPAQPYINK